MRDQTSRENENNPSIRTANVFLSLSPLDPSHEAMTSSEKTRLYVFTENRTVNWSQAAQVLKVLENPVGVESRGHSGPQKIFGDPPRRPCAGGSHRLVELGSFCAFFHSSMLCLCSSDERASNVTTIWHPLKGNRIESYYTCKNGDSGPSSLPDKLETKQGRAASWTGPFASRCGREKNADSQKRGSCASTTLALLCFGATETDERFRRCGSHTISFLHEVLSSDPGYSSTCSVTTKATSSNFRIPHLIDYSVLPIIDAAAARAAVGIPWNPAMAHREESTLY